MEGCHNLFKVWHIGSVTEHHLHLVLPDAVPVRLDVDEVAKTDVAHLFSQSRQLRKLLLKSVIQGVVLLDKLVEFGIRALACALQLFISLKIHAALLSLLHSE